MCSPVRTSSSTWVVCFPGGVVCFLCVLFIVCMRTVSYLASFMYVRICIVRLYSIQ
jgi:hypothetical protein